MPPLVSRRPCLSGGWAGGVAALNESQRRHGRRTPYFCSILNAWFHEPPRMPCITQTMHIGSR